ncbi:MAG: glycosyltransferase family 1 protein [Halobacteriovoraceae bacterium]|nr:glycosyltransferase family 1 protein [Halobacteriovoraceae bacterium]
MLMKIGYDAKRIFHNFRGLGNYGRNLIEGMNSWYPENQYYLYTPPIIDNRAVLWRKKITRPRIITPPNKILKTLSPLWRSFFIGSDLQKKNIDIYHGLSHELPFNVNRKTKQIVTIHDLIFIRHPRYFPFLDRKIYLKKIIHSCKQADIIVAISGQSKRDLVDFLQIPEEKIRVVYQSCHPCFYRDVPHELQQETLAKYNLNNDYILYVGAIEERKNILRLVNAFAKLPTHHRMVLIGTGSSYKNKVIARIKMLGLENKILLLENVPQQDLPALYRNARVFVYPSLFEGFGIPIIEAMFSETPVMTSQGSCFSEAGGPNSVYVNPYKEDEISQGILRILSDKNLAKHMTQTGRKFAERFHLRQTTRDMMNVYRDITAR